MINWEGNVINWVEKGQMNLRYKEVDKIGNRCYSNKRKSYDGDITLEYLLTIDKTEWENYAIVELLDKIIRGLDGNRVCEEIINKDVKERIIKGIGKERKGDVLDTRETEDGENTETYMTRMVMEGMNLIKSECLADKFWGLKAGLVEYYGKMGLCYEEVRKGVEDRFMESVREREKEYKVLFNEGTARRVKTLAGLGLPLGQIAMGLGLRVVDLTTIYGRDMAEGVLEANEGVAVAIYNEALHGNARLLTLWAKARLGWAETPQVVAEPAKIDADVKPIRVDGKNELERLERLCEKIDWKKD